MKNITNKDLKRMISLMGNKTPINENKIISSVELIKKSPNGKFYGVVKENKKYYIKESNDGSNFDFIGGVANKTKNQFESYEKAVRRLNLMLEDTNVLTPDVILEKKFVIKSKKKKTEEPKAEEGGGDFGGDEDTKETESGGDFDFGGDEDTEETEGGDFGGDEDETEGEDFDFGGDEDTEETEGGDFGDEDTEEVSDEETDEDLDLEDEGEDSIKYIQKMTGKLGQKLRDTEDLSSDTMKWVAKSVLSALDLGEMDSEDKKDLIRTIKKKKDEGSDEEFDFMRDEKGTMSLPIMTYMSDDDMVDWNKLSDEQKAEIVNYPGDTEKPMMDWDEEGEEKDITSDDMCSHCAGLGYDDMTGEDCEWCMGTGVQNMEDYMMDGGEDDPYGPSIGAGEIEAGEKIISDEDDEDHCSYCGDRDVMPYNEEEPYETYPGVNEPDWRRPRMDYMSKFAKTVKRAEAVKGKKMDPHEIDSHLNKIKNKLGGDVDVDDDKVVGNFGYVEVKPSGYVVHKEGQKFGKNFQFNELGKLHDYVKGEDYMDDPYMMPQPAPARPQRERETPVKPAKPGTDTPNPRKKPFTPPPHITPGEEPNPKAWEEELFGDEYYDEYEEEYGDEYGDEYYGPTEGMDYMKDEEPGYYGSFKEWDRWLSPMDAETNVELPSYEYEEFEYPDYESFRTSEFGKDPKNRWFAKGEQGKTWFNKYRDKFGPMKIRKKRDVNYDETSKMFGNLDYMDETDFDLGPKIKGRPANNPIAARGNVSKTYLTDLQKRNREAKRQADTDISKHFNKYGDFNSHETPSDDWRQYPLPYDTHFGDDVDYMEDDSMEVCSACEGRGHEKGGMGFNRKINPCITCAGTGSVPRMEVDDEVDEPYIDPVNPMGYQEGETTLPKGLKYNYEYKEKFNFPFNLGENSRSNKRTIKEDHLNNKMASYEQEMAYEDVESMARQHGMDVELCHKDRAKDPEEQTIYLDLMKKGKAVAKIRINTAGDVEMGHMTGKVFKGEPVDSHSDFDEVLAEKGIKMMPQPAPARPQTRPETPVKPARPDTDKPSPRKKPFTPPPHITPGEEPNPKAGTKKRKSFSYMDDSKNTSKPSIEPTKPSKDKHKRPTQHPFIKPGEDPTQTMIDRMMKR